MMDIDTKELLEQSGWIRTILRDVYVECDGFYVYEQTHRGYLNEWSLRLIANVLEDLNWSWTQEINRYFEELQNENLKAL